MQVSGKRIAEILLWKISLTFSMRSNSMILSSNITKGGMLSCISILVFVIQLFINHYILASI